VQQSNGSESDILKRAIVAAAAAHPQDRILCIVDRRSSSAAAPGLPRYIVATIAPASPWHELLPPNQIAEIVDRGSGSLE
jgi:hypothetical protein